MRRSDRGLDWAPQVVLGIGLVAAGVLLLSKARSLWFFGDDFEFLLTRSVTLGGDHGLLVPHNEHWSTIPILLFRLNFAIFGLQHYLPYALVPIGFHILVAVLAFVVLRISGANAWIAVIGGLVVGFTAGGAGAENTLWDFQAGFLGSCFFGVLALTIVAARRWGHVAGVLAAGALVLSLMSSGMGTIMVVWVAVYLFLRDGLRSAVTVVAVPAVVYAVWYATYGHGHTGAPPPDLSLAPLVALHGLGSLWSSASGIPGAGPALLLGMVAAVTFPRHDPGLFALAASGLVTVVMTYALLGYSRSGLGVDAAEQSRYVYFGVVLTVPALAAALEVLGRALGRRPARVVVVTWLATVATVLVVGAAQAGQWSTTRRAAISDTKGRLVAAAQLAGSGAPMLRSQPMPDYNPDISTTALETTSVRSALPDVRPDPAAELYVAGRLQVDVAGSAHSFPPPSGVQWRGFDPPAGPHQRGATATACETRTSSSRATIQLTSHGEPVELRISVSGSHLGTQLVSGQRHSPVVRWDMRPRVPVYVASTAEAEILRLVVPGGTTTVCAG